MTADRRAAQVEKVAMLFCDTGDKWGGPCDTVCEVCANKAAAAISLIREAALEEAAKCAEYRCGSAEWSADTNSGYEYAAKEIAAAIRALKGN